MSELRGCTEAFLMKSVGQPLSRSWRKLLGSGREFIPKCLQFFDVGLGEGRGEATTKSEKRPGVDLCGYFWLVIMILLSQEC